MSYCSLTGGTIKDYLTGRDMPDCDDEQIRQKLERLLVEEKGYAPADIEVDRFFEVALGDERKPGRAELSVIIDGRPLLTVKCARGSLVTREQEAIAASRLAFEVMPPYTVVTNGVEAELLETASGRVAGTGFEAIPTRAEAERLIGELDFPRLTEKQKEKAARIHLAYAVFECSNFCES